MGLAELQSALARLYTVAEDRALLLSNPADFAARHGLSKAETQMLLGELLPEVQRLAGSLLRKRIQEATRAMPLAKEILGPRFDPALRRFAELHPLGPMRNPALDALDFHRWLLSRKGAELSAGERGGLRYSEGWLSMQNTRRRFLVRVLPPGAMGVGATRLAIWWRWGGRVRHRVS